MAISSAAIRRAASASDKSAILTTRSKALRMRVRYALVSGGAVVEADDLETLPVVQLQRLHDQMGGGVIVQIGRDIADAQARLRRQGRRRLVGNGRRVAIGLRHLLRGAEMIGGGGARHGEQRKWLDAIARPLVGAQRPEQALLERLGRSPIGNAPRGMGRADAIGERVGQRRCPRIVIGSRLQAPLFRQQIGEVVVGADMVGFLRQHALIFRDGVLGLAEIGERIGEHHARARAGTVDRERFLQRRDGAREVARAAIEPTEMLPRQGILWRQGDGVEQRLLGILEGLARRLDVAEGAPGARGPPAAARSGGGHRSRAWSIRPRSTRAMTDRAESSLSAATG